MLTMRLNGQEAFVTAASWWSRQSGSCPPTRQKARQDCGDVAYCRVDNISKSVVELLTHDSGVVAPPEGLLYKTAASDGEHSVCL